MRKLKVLIFVPLSFILFYLVSYHASANTNSNNNLSFNIENVSKHFVSGTTNKYTNVNVLGKNIRSNTKGYFRIYLKNSIRYNKLTKFHLTKNKMSKNVYARLYSTKGININTVAKATKYASSIITGKSAHNYIWGGTYDKKKQILYS
ncbi:hypothetical protein [Apilactobacillus ozensis]|uniref:hypothetical protein n=1 Tax=Apilactobacillus ozensis TaxID=866801 RepID=UPI0006CF84B6|nr:hypothetical protein [Apilactobacillus ozensis]